MSTVSEISILVKEEEEEEEEKEKEKKRLVRDHLVQERMTEYAQII
jgi:hypothetical protein